MYSQIFFCQSLLVFLRSRASARIGKRKEPPGREKIAIAGRIFAMFFRWFFISIFSSLVHFSSVFRVFIRSCISPLIARTSIRMTSLFIMMSLLRYLLIIGKPGTTGGWGQVYFLSAHFAPSVTSLIVHVNKLPQSFVLSRGIVF
jgi:hypothetical protein